MAKHPGISGVEADSATTGSSLSSLPSAQPAQHARLHRSVSQAPSVAPATPPAHERQWRVLIGALLLLDGLAVWSSLALAFSVRMTTGLLGYYGASYDPAQYRLLALLSIPLWLTVFALNGLYRRDNLVGGLLEYQSIFRSCVTGVVLLIVLSYFWREYAMLSRGWLTLAWVLSLLFVTAERFFVRRAAYWGRRRGWLTSRVLIVGANDQGVAMARQWLAAPTSGMEVVGFLDDFKPPDTTVIDGLEVIGRPSALAEVAHRLNVQDVIVVPTAVAWETFENLVMQAHDGHPYVLRFSPGLYEILATGVAVTNKTFVPLYTVNEARLVGAEAVLKTAFDYGLALCLLVATLPVMALVAGLLKLIAPKEAILVPYPTIGQCGRQFTMHKFRTAHRPRVPGDSEAVVDSLVERLLYGTGLDKLPQVFNVLKNEMSLVGPRPRVVRAVPGLRAVVELSESDLDRRVVRTLQTVKPGITGAWAVAQGSLDVAGDADTELRYVRNWTLWLDLQLLFQSVRLWVHSSFWVGRLRGTPRGRHGTPSSNRAGPL